MVGSLGRKGPGYPLRVTRGDQKRLVTGKTSSQIVSWTLIGCLNVHTVDPVLWKKLVQEL